jgi:prepilin peptidase dependent protein A
MNIYKHNGFSLVELLIVMAIIGIMATFGIVSYPGIQKTARDTQRKSDLKQYHTSLESYANRKGGFYPSRNSQMYASDQNGATPNLCSTDLGLSQCPIDPKANQNVCMTGTCNYYFISNGTCAAGTACASSFVLYARLEKENMFYVICSNGSSGLKSVPWTPSASCPL